MATIGGPARRSLIAVSVLVCATAWLVAPARADAQQAEFFQGLSELTAAIEGTFGDEGARVGPALDRLSAALAAWDREIAAAEAATRTAPPQADPALVVERRLALGRRYADRGRLADALAEFDAAIVLAPRRADVHVLRGVTLHESGRRDQAIAAFSTARTVEPRDTVAAYLLFQALAGSGNAEAREAAADVTIARADPQGGRPSTRRAPFPQIARFPPGVTAPPLVPPALYRQAYVHIARREYEQALAELRTAATHDPLVIAQAAGSPAMRRAIGALREGRLAEARALIERAPQPDGSEALRVRGLVSWAGSDYERAIEELTAAIARDPRNERARLALARVYASAGRDEDAERSLLDTLRVLPESALARWWLASAYERLNRYGDARPEFERAASAAAAGQGQLHAAVGRLASATADFPAAADALRRAVSAQPNDPALHRLLGHALVQQDRPDEALAEFAAALLIDAADAEALAAIGRIHLDAGRNDDAAEVLRRAVERAPASVEARYAFAGALTRLGRTGEAAQEFAKVEQLQGERTASRRRAMSIDVLTEEAALRLSEGRLEAAALLYEKAVSLEPSPALYRRLAELYARLGRGVEAVRARTLAETPGGRQPAGRPGR